MQTIREVKIIVHLEQGKVELKAPDISGLLRQHEQQVEVTKRLDQETRRLNETEQKRINDELAGAAELRRLSDEASQRWKNTNEAKFFQGKMAGDKPAASTADQAREAFYAEEMNQSLRDRIALTKQLLAEEEKLKAAQNQQSQSSWNKGLAGLKTESWDRGMATMKARADAEREVARAAEEAAKAQEEASQKAVAAHRTALNAVGMVGEGIFRIARATVLLGATSEESLGKMIKSLARVQAYYDLLKGSAQIIKGVTATIEAMRAAQLAAAVAAGTMSAAEAAAATSTLTLAAAAGVLMAVLTPLAIVLGAIAGALLLLDYAWQSSAEAAKEAAEAAAENRRISEEGMREYLTLLEQRLSRERQVADILFERMGAEEQAAEIASRVQRGAEAGERGQRIIDEVLFADGQAQALEIERAAALDAIRAINQLEAAERQRIDNQKSLLDGQLKSIEAAEKDLEIAKQKERTFQIQFGMLQQFEQTQLKAIADRLRAGQDINQFEEQFLREKGGEAGANIANARAGRRGIAAGADDVFAGIPDAMDTAAKSVDQLEKVLADLLTELKKGGTAIEAKARIEAESKALQKQYEDFFKGNTEAIKKLADVVEQLNKKIDAVSLAVAANGG